MVSISPYLSFFIEQRAKTNLGQQNSSRCDSQCHEIFDRRFFGIFDILIFPASIPIFSLISVSACGFIFLANISAKKKDLKNQFSLLLKAEGFDKKEKYSTKFVTLPL